MKENIAQYLALMENSFSAVFLARPTGEVLNGNIAAEKIFGYKEAELVKIGLKGIFDYGDLIIAQALTKVKGRGEKGILHGIRKNGEKFPVEFTSTLLTNIEREEHIFIIINDISESKKLGQKQEDQELRLMSAVVNSTNDAVMILEAEPLDEPGPKIVYINESFTRMTGYTEEEALGKNPRFLQGPNSDRMEFTRLRKAMENKESCEITSINYKKDGEQFWVDFSISPVANRQGLVTHFIALERDITLRKNEDLQKSLLYDLSRIFNSGMKLPDTLTEIIKLIYSFGGFCLAEAWLTEEDNNKIKLVSSYSETRNNHPVNSPGDKTYSLSLGEGHAGLAWKTKEIQYWRESTCHEKAMDHRKGTGFAIPLLNNEQVIGVLIFEHEDREYERPNSVGIYKKIGNYLGPEIKRKQLEQELEQLFKFAPGIISVTGMNGLIKKINPAACELLEYPEEELMKSTLMNFVHVEDRGRTDTEYENLKKGKPVPYLENRFITKSGKVKWLAWALTSSPNAIKLRI